MITAALLLATSGAALEYAAVQTAAPASQGNTKQRGDELIRRDSAKKFADWVVEVPGAIWGAAVSREVRQRYADNQYNASAALLAYEKANDFYAAKKSFVMAATQCSIRTKEWAWSIDDKLNQAAKQDAALQSAKKALTAIELDTGDAYWTFSLYAYIGRITGKDRAAGCRSLAAMPFLRTLDRYEAGAVDQLPRP
jgi:hypothetical protein